MMPADPTPTPPDTSARGEREKPEELLAEILARPTSVRTYPAGDKGGMWKATLLPALGHINALIRPYGYIGYGATEQEAIDDLLAREAADTWEAGKCP